MNVNSLSLSDSPYFASPSWKTLCRDYLPLVLVIGSLFIFHISTWQYLYGRWTDWVYAEYSHGPLVLLLVPYMVYLLRHELASIPVQPAVTGLILIFVLESTWFIAGVLGVRSIESTALGLIIPAAVIALYGWKRAWAIRLPLIFLMLAFPIWSLGLPWLQDFTTAVCAGMLRLLNVPVFVQSHHVSIPEGVFYIEDGCSGLRYLLAATALGIFFVFINNFRGFRACRFVALMMALAVLANLIRVTAVIYVGHRSEMQHPWVSDHLHIGWALFAAFCIVPLWIARTYPSDASPGSRQTIVQFSIPRKRFIASLSLIIAAMIAMSLGRQLVTEVSESGVAATEPIQIPTTAGWRMVDEPIDSWRPKFSGSDQEFRAAFRAEDLVVQAFIAHYRSQRGDDRKEITGYRNRVYDAEHWRLARESTARTVVLPSGEPHGVIETVIRDGRGGERLVWHWYRVAGRSTNQLWAVKLLELLGLLSGDVGSSVIVIGADYLVSMDNARDVLGRFMHGMGPALTDAVDQL
jgi:EpsI family protein